MKIKTAIIAVVVVAIIVVAGVAVVLWPTGTPAPAKVIYWTQIAPVNQKAALLAGTVDAAVGWEPYSSDAILNGNSSAVIWSDQIWPHHPCCVIAVKYSTSFPANATNINLVERVVKADIVATQWILETIQEGSGANYTMMLNMGAAFSGTSPTVVQDALNHIEYQYQITQSSKDGMANFTGMFDSLGQTIVGHGGYSNITNFVNGITNTSYVSQAMDIAPSATILGTIRLGYLNGDLHQFARVVAMNTTLWGGQTLFHKYGVAITSPAPMANGGAVMDAFAGGNIDMGYLGCPPAILRRINVGTPITIIAMVNNEGSALVARYPIHSLAELNGKLVATPGPASIQHLLLLYYATQNGYTVKLKGT
ncbi:MAG TPA: ABC transporter substrate-binding protein [Methanomassiliicoccales archaeon]|nr:ABC transporter substrate-binding protein [Methanomassiliicoccales archaeon]